MCVPLPRPHAATGDYPVLTAIAAAPVRCGSHRAGWGEHPDWDDYRRVMLADQRALIRITIERAGPDRQG